MKKIGIVTLYHKNYNYGGQLQAYAMTKIFTTDQTEAKLITFENDSKKYFLRRIKDLGLKKTIKSITNKVRFKLLMRNSAFKSEYDKKLSRFDKFIEETPHTQLYNSDTISNSNNEFDLFVCGSDQIWNPGWWSDILVLGFAKKPKFSYAASIARTKLSEEEIAYLRENTKDYEAIAVREMQAKEMLEKYLKRDIEFVLDPTLLVKPEDWLQIANDPDVSDEYVFIYMLGNSQELKAHIYEECHRKGYKVALIGYSKNTYYASEEKYSDIVIKDAGPREWIGWIKNAKYVFTDSFHATVFSIMLQKQFWTFEKGKLKEKQNENSRLYSLLKIAGLESRMVAHDKKFFESDADNTIDYEKVNNSLMPYREKSFEYIKKHI